MKYFVLFLSFFVILDFCGHCSSQNSNKIVGGLYEERPVNDEVRQMIAATKKPIKTSIRSTKLGATQKGTITPISYRTQLVNGTNYFIKVRTQVGRKYVYYHVRIFKEIDGTIHFMRVQGPMTPEETITFF